MKSKLGDIMNKLKLTSLEHDVLNALLAGDDPVLSLLRDQLEQAISISREETGVGFFLMFELPRNVKKTFEINHAVKSSFCFGDVDASINGLNNGAGFLIWVTDGCLRQLEGYTYGDAWPSNVDNYIIKYRDNKREIQLLQQEWLSSN
jgi:hypothetical protein